MNTSSTTRICTHAAYVRTSSTYLTSTKKNRALGKRRTAAEYFNWLTKNVRGRIFLFKMFFLLLFHLDFSLITYFPRSFDKYLAWLLGVVIDVFQFPLPITTDFNEAPMIIFRTKNVAPIRRFKNVGTKHQLLSCRSPLRTMSETRQNEKIAATAPWEMSHNFKISLNSIGNLHGR